MNTTSNAIPNSAIGAQTEPAALSPTQPLYWCLRRELWENRSIYIVPLALAGLFLLGFMVSLARLPQQMRDLPAYDPLHQRSILAAPYDFSSGLMMLAVILVSVFYCVDALQSERRDRSILFWKSLPVSDFTTVMSKALIPIVVVPVFAFAVAVALQWIMLLLSSAVLVASGLSVTTLWSKLSFFQMSLLLLYHLLTAHALWPAPVYGWLLLVSGWARRAALLWAVVPLVAISAIEWIIFHTWHFANLIASRFIGDFGAGYNSPESFPTNPMTHVHAGHFLLSPGLWIGLLVTAGFLAAAVKLRRHRGPI
jgi:ABC-2 type transport system permease protein